MLITTILSIVSTITSVLAIYIVIKQNKKYTKEKAPILSLKHINVFTTSAENNKLLVTVHNHGQRTAYFKYAYVYVLNISCGIATANPVFTTQEILPNQDATWGFDQLKSITLEPDTFYCAKIWYDDTEIKCTEPRELYFKLDNPKGMTLPASIPNNVLELFKIEIAQYERSSLFKSSDT